MQNPARGNDTIQNSCRATNVCWRLLVCTSSACTYLFTYILFLYLLCLYLQIKICPDKRASDSDRLRVIVTMTLQTQSNTLLFSAWSLPASHILGLFLVSATADWSWSEVSADQGNYVSVRIHSECWWRCRGGEADGCLRRRSYFSPGGSCTTTRSPNLREEFDSGLKDFIM